MGTTWTIRPHRGAPVPERWSKAEQRAITKATGAIPQRPGVPGATVYDADDRPVLAISDFDEVRPDGKRKGMSSTAELLAPAPPGASWPAVGRIEHPGLGWTTYVYADLEGTVRGEGTAPNRSGVGWGLWAGATVRAGADVWTLDDLLRPETDEERARSERRRFFRSRRFAGRVLGHRFVASDGSEAGRLAWVGEHQPEHHARPYEWRFDWHGDPDDAVFVGAMAAALRFMAYVGSMLSMD